MRRLKGRNELDPRIDRTIRLVFGRLGNPPDLISRRLPLPRARGRIAILYFKQFADAERVSDGVTSALRDPLLIRTRKPSDAVERLAAALPTGNALTTKRLDQVVSALLAGSVVLLGDGSPQAVLISMPPARRRAVDRPDVETSIRGPQEAFVENVDTNLALLRHRLRTPELRILEFRIGRRSQTKVYLVWLEGVADPDLVSEIQRRLARIDIDMVYDAASLVDRIEDSTFALWPQIKITQRPDVTCANLTEGRAAVLWDGSPFALVMPVVFWQLFQAVDDYVGRFMSTSWIRLLRVLAAGLSLTGPALYVAVTTFHQELIPPALAVSLAAGREAVPFPAALESLIMKVALDLLAEAGLRLPRAVGPAVSIVGALILGEAAVSAGLASPGMVIVIAGTAIAGFALPDISLADTIRYLSYFLIILASTTGLFGLSWGIIVLAIILSSQRSFGIPLLYPVAPGSPQQWYDVFMRLPYWSKVRRPRLMARDPVRSKGGPPKPPPTRERQ